MTVQPMCISSFEEQAQSCLSGFNERKYRNSLPFRRERYAIFDDPLTTFQYTFEEKGPMEQLSGLIAVLDMFGMDRSPNQRDFHRACLLAVIPIIFEGKLDQYHDKLCAMFDTKVFQQEVLCVAPRQFGKTVSTAMFVAGCAIILPAKQFEHFTQCIFSTCRRASSKLLKFVSNFIRIAQRNSNVPTRVTIIAENIEELHLRGPGGPSDIRKVLSFPSKIEVRSLQLQLYWQLCLILYVGRFAVPPPTSLSDSHPRNCSHSMHRINEVLALLYTATTTPSPPLLTTSISAPEMLERRTVAMADSFLTAATFGTAAVALLVDPTLVDPYFTGGLTPAIPIPSGALIVGLLSLVRLFCTYQSKSGSDDYWKWIGTVLYALEFFFVFHEIGALQIHNWPVVGAATGFGTYAIILFYAHPAWRVVMSGIYFANLETGKSVGTVSLAGAKSQYAAMDSGNSGYSDSVVCNNSSSSRRFIQT